MQLHFFQWDLVEAANGHACLAKLDFDQAEAHFSRVLVALPGHQMAESGLRSVQYWQQVFEAIDDVERVEALTCLWQRIKAFAFPAAEVSRMLRANLIRHLLSLINGTATLRSAGFVQRISVSPTGRVSERRNASAHLA